MDTTFPAPVRTYLTAVNAFEGATLITAFSDDAVVNDTRREFSGVKAIRAWVDREIIGDMGDDERHRYRTHETTSAAYWTPSC
jgi:hypothetical protein